MDSMLNRDRATWGSGPWNDEPDKREWKTEAGLPGMIVRNPYGALCGYVAVPPGHAAHGKHYDDVSVEVHGGLTYADKCQGNICHVPAEGEPDNVWWLGFDCAHAGDLTPGLNRYGASYPGDIYRRIEYVAAEVESLARQLVQHA